MKYSFLKTIALRIIGLAALLLFVSLLTSLSRPEWSYPGEKFSCTSIMREHGEIELFITANDFDVAQQYGKPESIQSIVTHPLQAEKLIRNAIFDHDRITELTRTLTWYVRSTYFASLSPLWCPSIPIAHRRLII
jgi:hypothetical protein